MQIAYILLYKHLLGHVNYCLVNTYAIAEEALPGYPNCLQAASAALKPNPDPHTVPHVPSCN